MDTTTEFLTAFYSQKFSSFEEFHCKLRDFEKLTGSIYIIHTSKFLPQEHADRGRLVYSALQYSCYHYGVCQNNVAHRRNQRLSRGLCGARISLSAMNGKLWITKYHMIHSHNPLPESVEIDQSIRRLQVQESGKGELIISDEIQVVLDDIVNQLPNHNTSVESYKMSPSKPERKPVLERKAAARDRLAARTKKARGLKLAPCLRRLAELASAGTGQEFHKHLDELEALVDIWKRGDTSSLAEASDITRTETKPVTTSDSLAITKAVESLFRKQKTIKNQTFSLPTATKRLGRPPKTAHVLTSAIQATSQPAILKHALDSQSNAFIINSDSQTTLPNGLVLADSGNGQLQLINGASLISTAGIKNENGQSFVGYVIQSMPPHSSSGQNLIASTTNFVPIAPKLPSSEQLGQAFQPMPLRPPKVAQPPPPVCRLGGTKPRGRQPKVKSTLNDDGLIVQCNGPSVVPFTDPDGLPKPWTSMIMEGESCPYFLFVEDANYCFSPEEDAWVPADQQTTAVDTVS